jgi:hypothetical protein
MGGAIPPAPEPDWTVGGPDCAAVTTGTLCALGAVVEALVNVGCDVAGAKSEDVRVCTVGFSSLLEVEVTGLTSLSSVTCEFGLKPEPG